MIMRTVLVLDGFLGPIKGGQRVGSGGWKLISYT